MDEAASDGRKPNADPYFAPKSELRYVRPSGEPGRNVYSFHTKDRELYDLFVDCQVTSPDTDKESPEAVELANWRVSSRAVDTFKRQIWDSIKSRDAPPLLKPEGEPSLSLDGGRR